MYFSTGCISVNFFSYHIISEVFPMLQKVFMMLIFNTHIVLHRLHILYLFVKSPGISYLGCFQLPRAGSSTDPEARQPASNPCSSNH